MVWEILDDNHDDGVFRMRSSPSRIFAFNKHGKSSFSFALLRVSRGDLCIILACVGNIVSLEGTQEYTSKVVSCARVHLWLFICRGNSDVESKATRRKVTREFYTAYFAASSPFTAACAAANRAMSTRNGEHET